MTPARLVLSILFSCALLALVVGQAGGPFSSKGARGAAPDPVAGTPAPEFPSLDTASWVGSPVSMAALKGRVVLLNVWTFGCWNCARTLPWVESVYERFEGRGLAVIGVHSPEFDRERDPSEVEEARRAHGLRYPSFLDNGHLYWRALGNRYWPTVYLIDRKGTIRRVFVGEVHAGDSAAASLESQIDSLLLEPTSAFPPDR